MGTRYDLALGRKPERVLPASSVPEEQGDQPGRAFGKTSPGDIRPGDVISATLFNEILERLKILEDAAHTHHGREMFLRTKPLS